MKAKISYTRLYVTFLNPRTEKKRRVFFNISDNKIAQRWATLLEEKFELDSFLFKNFIFHGWPVKGRTFSELCRQMNAAIARINKYFAKTEVSYKIKMKFSPTSLSQNKFNQIHRHFENLMGQTWSPSDHMKAMDLGAHFDVAQLNWLAHEMECKLMNKTLPEQQREKSLFFSFLPSSPRPLTDEDYKFLEPYLEWGDVFLHYAQLGKSLWELYNHDDEIAGHDNVSVVRYVSGEFDICFSQTDSKAMEASALKMKRWLKEKNFDLTKPHMKFGSIKVAKIEMSQLKGETPKEFMRTLLPFDSVSEIGLIRSNKTTISKKYPLEWNVRNYREKAIFQSKRSMGNLILRDPKSLSILLERAKSAGVDPQLYLKHLLTRLPKAKTSSELDRAISYDSKIKF